MCLGGELSCRRESVCESLERGTEGGRGREREGERSVWLRVRDCERWVGCGRERERATREGMMEGERREGGKWRGRDMKKASEGK